MQCRLIYDLADKSGPAEVFTHTVSAEEAIARDPARYVRKLPPGVQLGPKQGLDRIVLM
jgi:hypothetical protein